MYATLPLLLALAAAAGAGTADYLAGVASRRAAATFIAAAIQTIGLAIIALALLIGDAALPGSRDMVLAVVAGISIAAGITALYRALAIGPIGITAPTAAVTGAAVPVFVSLWYGDALSALQYIGLGIGVLGIALFASQPHAGSIGDRWSGLVLALLAGLGIAGFTVALEAADPSTGFWPLAVARGFAATGLWLVCRLSLRVSADIARGWRVLVLAGILDGAAMVAFVAALQIGHLAVVAVLASLYPAFTVLLATMLDGERLRRPQLAGLFCAGIAVVCIGIPA